MTRWESKKPNSKQSLVVQFVALEKRPGRSTRLFAASYRRRGRITQRATFGFGSGHSRAIRGQMRLIKHTHTHTKEAGLIWSECNLANLNSQIAQMSRDPCKSQAFLYARGGHLSILLGDGCAGQQVVSLESCLSGSHRAIILAGCWWQLVVSCPLWRQLAAGQLEHILFARLVSLAPSSHIQRQPVDQINCSG